MDTETPVTPEITSSESLPGFARIPITQSTGGAAVVTTTSTEEGGYKKAIVVRGTGTLSVTIKMNIESEASAKKNLIANRGQATLETTGLEG
jgi:siroheme synthase